MTPTNREILEMQVIGCCFRSENLFIEFVQDISEDDFLYPRTNKLFKALKKIINSGKSIDESSASREACDEMFTYSEAIAFSIQCSHESLCVRTEDAIEVFKEEVALEKAKSLARRMINFQNDGNGSVLGFIESVKQDIAQIEVNRFCEIIDPSISIKNYENGKSFQEVIKNRIKDFKEGNAKIAGFSFGIPLLDKLTGGVGTGEIIILGARTGMGKTQFAVDLLRKWAEMKIPVAMFSMEMTVKQLDNRFVSQISSIPIARFEEGNLTSFEEARLFNAADLYSNLNISFCDKSGLKPSDIRSHLYKMKQKKGVKIAVIDFLTLMNSDKKSSNNHEKYGEVIKDLQEIAKSLEISLVVLVQLNRSNERAKEPPIKADIKESSAIAEAANVILFLHREDYYEIASSTGEVSLILDKVRSRGCRHVIPMKFDMASGKYFETKEKGKK